MRAHYQAGYHGEKLGCRPLRTLGNNADTSQVSPARGEELGIYLPLPSHAVWRLPLGCKLPGVSFPPTPGCELSLMCLQKAQEKAIQGDQDGDHPSLGQAASARYLAR